MKTATAEPIDVETAKPESQAVALRSKEAVQTTTAAQAKTDAIAQLTMKAYDKASTLVLSADEIKELKADFPDEAFKPKAGGKTEALYVEHAYLRDRLDSVLGPGQWTLINRSRWAEDFEAGDPPQPCKRIYWEGMFLIRGCFVTEKIGDMAYFPHNPSQNYADAAEGAQTACLRRCCKELGIGLQSWKKDFCEAWWERNREWALKYCSTGKRNSNTRGLNTLSGASGPDTRRGEGQPAKSEPRTEPARTVEPVKPPKCATAVTRQYLLDTFTANTGQVNHPKFLEYCSKAGMLTGTQTVKELSLCYVPVDKRQMDLWTAAFNGFVEGDPPAIPFKNPEPSPKPEQSPKPNGAEVPRDQGVGTWRDFQIPFGKNAGKKLSQLDRNQLAAYARMMDEECEFETYEDKKTGQTRKKSATSMATNRRFKEQLDAWRAEMGVEKEAA